MKRWLRKRKAVSPVIAALLLIAISVAAAVLTYSWVMSMIGTQGKQSQTSIRIEDVLLDQWIMDGVTYDGLKVTVRNSGAVAATIKSIYLYRGDTLTIKAETITDEYVILPGASGVIGVIEATMPVDVNTWPTWVPPALTKLSKLGPEPADAGGRIYSLTDDDPIIFYENLIEGREYNVKIVTDIGVTTEYQTTSPEAFTGDPIPA